MNYLITLLLLLPCCSWAQDQQAEPLVFDQKYYTCEDQWVAFPKKEEEFTYIYGFIYLDEQAGFTFNLEGKLEVNDAGQLMAVPKDEKEEGIGSLKIRLEPRTTDVAVLTSKQLQELKLPEEPEWLTFYKEDQGKVKSLVARGYHYNHVGACKTALQNLEKAYALEPTFDGLFFEMAFAYNATEQYKKAEEILIQALKEEPKNYFLYRELGFAQIRLDQLKKAEKTYEKGIRLSDNAYQKSEMAVNMTQAYFKLKQKKGFKKWAALTRKYAAKDAPFLEYIDYWEKEMQ